MLLIEQKNSQIGTESFLAELTQQSYKKLYQIALCISLQTDIAWQLKHTYFTD